MTSEFDKVRQELLGKTKKRKNKEVKPKRRWEVNLGGNQKHPFLVAANTKSEARTQMKKLTEGKLPIGTVIAEVK